MVFLIRICLIFFFFFVIYHSKWILVMKQTLKHVFEASFITPKKILPIYLGLYLRWAL